MAEAVLSTVVENVGRLLVEEVDLLRGVEEEVEWIEAELKLMSTFLEDLEALEGLDESQKHQLEEFSNVARYAEEVITTLVLQSVQERRRGVFKRHILFFKKLVDRHKLAKNLEKVRVQISDLSAKRSIYDFREGSVTEVSILQRTLTSSSVQQHRMGMTDMTLVPSVQQHGMWMTDMILQHLVAAIRTGRSPSLDRKVDEQVAELRNHMSYAKEILDKMTSNRELDERDKVWMEQIREISRIAEDTVQQREQPRVSERLFRRVIQAVNYLESQLKVGKKVDQVKKMVCDAIEREEAYGIGKIKGRKGLSSTLQSQQENEPSTAATSGHSDLGCSEEAPPGSSSQKSMLDTAIYLFSKKLVYQFTRPSEEELEEQVQWMRRELRLMHALFKDVGPMEELDGRTQIWVEELMGVAHNVEALISTYEGTSISRWPVYVSSRLKVAKEAPRIKNRIHEISKRRMAYGIEHIKRREESRTDAQLRSLQQGRPPLSYTVKAPGIMGVNNDVLAITRLLADDKHLSVISIVGMGGTGKTTLAKLIYDNDSTVYHFPYRAWVSITPLHSDAGSLLQDIGRQVMGLRELKTEEIAEDPMQMLNAFLPNERYLIVLDDVQNTEVWDSLKGAFPDTSNGSRIIFTTRNTGVAIQADPKGFPHRMQLLSDDDSWELFTYYLKVNIQHNSELLNLRRKILRRCGGLRLAIEKLGNLLSDAEPTSEEWSRKLEEFNLDQNPWLETLDVINKLPLYLRRCLFYLSLFPVEFEIAVRRLIVLWVAEGLVRQSSGSEDPPEYVAERYLAELIDRNMIQVTKRKLTGNVKTCCLPDALRKIWLPKVTTLGGHTNTGHGMIPRLADHLEPTDASFDHIHVDTKSPSSLLRYNYKNVLSFLSFDTKEEGSRPGEDIENFLYRCISSGCFLSLRVLDLEGVFRPKFPKALGKLIRLRYLGLRWTYLEMLPSFISNLLDLQTLDVKHTYISTLPSSIWKMERLRHLYLSESYRCRFAPQPHGSSVMDLQTLWGVFIDEESPVKDGLDRLINLKSLGLASRLMSSQQRAMSSRLDAVADWVQNLKQLRSLRLKSYDELGRPWYLPLKRLSGHTNLSSIYFLGRLKNRLVMAGLPLGLTELTLSASRLKRDPMQALRNLPTLRILRLVSGSFIGKTMLCSSGGFLQLLVLKLWKLEHLEEWKVEEGALPNLGDLEIRSCIRLKLLPDGLEHVSALQELKLSNMPKEFMDRIEDNQGQDWDKIAHIRYVYKED